jgi:hypothetical protein
VRAVGPASTRVARVALKPLAAGLLAVSLAGCGGSVDAADEAPPALREALEARTVYPAKREEWRADITHHTDSTMVPRVFRASRTTVALLQSSPTRISQFELHGHGMLLSTRPGRIDATLHAQVPRDIVAPTDLSRVTEDGQVDVVDSATSTLVRESIGGYMFRRELPLLRGGSGRLCTVAPATLLHLRQLGDRRALEAFTLTANASDDALVGRHRIIGEASSRLRFGGGDSRRCLLLTAHDVLIVSAPAGEGATDAATDARTDAATDVATDAAHAAPRLARLRPPGEPSSLPVADTLVPTGRLGGPREAQQPFVVDAAIVDGGFVVLVGVTSDRQGRIVDYYDERGSYLQSAMLPFTASAMAGAGPRFLVLHQDQRYRWWLSSWLTPMAARGATPPPDPPRVDRAPERQLFEPPVAGSASK